MHREEDLESGSADLFDREQIRDYLVFVAGSVRRRRGLVAAVISSILALTMLALAAVPRTYHVEAKLLAQKNPVLAVRGDGPDNGAPTRGAVETVRRRDNLVALIQATGLIDHWIAHRAPAQRVVDGLRRLARGEEDEQDKIDAMVERLEKRLVVWTNEGTVSIAIDWTDAQMACRLVNIAEQDFLEMRYAQEITALAESLAIFQGHAASLRSDIDDAVGALEKLRASKQAPRAEGAAAAPGAPPARFAPLRGAESGAADEQRRATINAKQRALDDLEQLRRHRLSEVQARLTEQRATYTENHPIVMDLTQAVAALQTPSREVKALRDEIAALRADHEVHGGSGAPAPFHASPAPLTVPPQLPTEILRLDQELREDRDPATVYARGQLRDAMDKYAALRAQVQAAQIDLETAQAAFKYRYSVLTPAQLPKRPTKPSVPLVLLAAFVASIFGAILVAVLADVRAGRLVEPWQIERLLDRPILGEVEVPRLPRHRAR